METKVNYAIVGIFVTALLAAIFVIIIWLSTGIKTTHYKIYQVHMNESVAGLSENAPVKFNGVTVGTVEAIELNLKDPQQVILTLEIEPNIPITETTRAILVEQGITGIAYIGLKTGKNSPPLKAKKGEKYPVIPASPSFLVKLDQTIETLSGSFTEMSNHVKALLSESNVKSIQGSLKNIEKISNTIAENDDNISKSLQDLQILLKNSAVASKRFPKIMSEIEKGSQAIQSFSAELSISSKSANKAFEQSDVAIQSFSNSIIPETYQTMQNIRDITENLKSLSSELQQNPAILLKGKTPQPLGPGEK